MDPKRSLVVGRVLCAVLLGALLGVASLLPARQAHADPITSNPYTGDFGPPNCTWYAWQRLHDTEHVDLQFSADAGYWIDLAAQANSAWDEPSGSYVQAQINTTPAAGDLAVLPFASSWAHPFHVAYVESVSNDGTIEVSEQSYGDYSAGQSTQPYPYVRHKTWNLAAMQDAEQGHARFLHFTGATPQSVDDFAFVNETTSAATVALNQSVHVAIDLMNTGTTTWTLADGYELDEISTNCTTCDAAHIKVGLDTQSIAPHQTWTAAFDLTAGPGQMCPVDAASSACDANSAGCPDTCFLLPQFVMMHGTTAFGVVLPLSIQVTSGPSPAPPGTPTVTGATPVSTTPATTGATPTQTSTATAAAAGDGATVSSESQQPTAQGGQHFSVYFLMRNTGKTSWSDASGYVFACTSSCMGASTVGLGGKAIAPGQEYQFNVNLTAPATPGTYRTWWTMEHSGMPFGGSIPLDISVQGWNPVLVQSAPACQSPAGTTWVAPLPSATLATTCGSSGFLMRQMSSNAYAEMDLKAVNNLPYDQTTFRTKVQVTFQDPTDTSTWAAVLVQTPQDPKLAGGYIFGLTAGGHWRLQLIASDSTIANLAEGQVVAAPSAILTVAVQSGQLVGSINQKPVVQWNDSLGANAQLGLLTELDNASPSAWVQYNAFELDQWG